MAQIQWHMQVDLEQFFKLERFLYKEHSSQRSSADHGWLPGPDLAGGSEAKHSKLSTGGRGSALKCVLEPGRVLTSRPRGPATQGHGASPFRKPVTRSLTLLDQLWTCRYLAESLTPSKQKPWAKLPKSTLISISNWEGLVLWLFYYAFTIEMTICSVQGVSLIEIICIS